MESPEQGDGSKLGGPASKTITQKGQNSSLRPGALMWSQLQNPPIRKQIFGFILLDPRAGEGEQGNFLIALSLPRKILPLALTGLDA